MWDWEHFGGVGVDKLRVLWYARLADIRITHLFIRLWYLLIRLWYLLIRLWYLLIITKK